MLDKMQTERESSEIPNRTQSLYLLQVLTNNGWKFAQLE